MINKNNKQQKCQRYSSQKLFTWIGELLFIDKGERKRKVDTHEEKPAKRKSVEYIGEVNEDAAANALQNPTVLDQVGNQKAVEDPSAEVIDTAEGSPSNVESAPESSPRNVSAETEEGILL